MGEVHGSGCVVCGDCLVYSAEATAVTCAVCGAGGASPVTCAARHFVCDRCHAAPALEAIERTCLASASTDPVALGDGPHVPSRPEGPRPRAPLPGAGGAAWRPGERSRLGVRLAGRGGSCTFIGQNAQCLGEPCPFHPERREPRAAGGRG